MGALLEVRNTTWEAAEKVLNQNLYKDIKAESQRLSVQRPLSALLRDFLSVAGHLFEKSMEKAKSSFYFVIFLKYIHGLKSFKLLN